MEKFVKVQRPVRKDVEEALPETVCISMYVLMDPITNDIRYVGQTVDPQNRYRNHIWEAKENNRNHKERWIVSLLRKNKRPIMKIIWSGQLTSDEANKVESKLIRYYKTKYKLTNALDRSRNTSVVETKPVYQFTMDGTFIRRYINANQAMLATGIHDSAITTVCTNPTGRGNRSRGGFLWSYSNEVLIPEKDYRRKATAKEVYQYTKEGVLVGKYYSARRASESTGICYKRISACITSRQKTAGGFIWKTNEDMV